MRRIGLFGLALMFLFFGIIGTLMFFAEESQAQDKCAKYYGKGYCVDYIKERLGKRPSGNAGTWKPNIAIKDVKPGDVAIFSSPGVGHVAIVERVIYERNTANPFEVEISEKNWGSASSNKDERDCYVTKNFNIVTRRTVRVSTVKGFWRP